jgi:hypothetical protein
VFKGFAIKPVSLNCDSERIPRGLPRRGFNYTVSKEKQVEGRELLITNF